VEFVCALWGTSVAVYLSELKLRGGCGYIGVLCGPPFLLTGGSGHSNPAVFPLGQSVGLMSGCGLLFVARGVVTLMAGPLEPLSGVLSQIVIKDAPCDLPSLRFETGALPLCIL